MLNDAIRAGGRICRQKSARECFVTDTSFLRGKNCFCDEKRQRRLNFPDRENKRASFLGQWRSSILRIVFCFVCFGVLAASRNIHIHRLGDLRSQEAAPTGQTSPSTTSSCTCSTSSGSTVHFSQLFSLSHSRARADTRGAKTL